MMGWKVSKEVPVERLEVFLDGRVVIWLADGTAKEVNIPEAVKELIQRIQEADK